MHDAKVRHIYETLYDGPDVRGTTDQIISLYEENLALLQSYHHNPQSELYDAVWRITADYALQMAQKAQNKASLALIQKSIFLVEQCNSFSKDLWFKSAYYVALIYNRGVLNHILGAYRKSKADFDFLKKQFPETLKYSLYHTASKLSLWEKAVQYIGFMAVALTILLFTSLPEDLEISGWFSILIYTLYGTSVGFALFTRFRRKKLSRQWKEKYANN